MADTVFCAECKQVFIFDGCEHCASCMGLDSTRNDVQGSDHLMFRVNMERYIDVWDVHDKIISAIKQVLKDEEVR